MLLTGMSKVIETVCALFLIYFSHVVPVKHPFIVILTPFLSVPNLSLNKTDCLFRKCHVNVAQVEVNNKADLQVRYSQLCKS